jgi:hypothetical protein
MLPIEPTKNESNVPIEPPKSELIAWLEGQSRSDLVSFRDTARESACVDFQAPLIIPSASLQIPIQRFTLREIQTGFVLENYPQDSWPKIVIVFTSESPLANLEARVFLSRSTNTATGEVLHTRIMVAMAQVCRCQITLPSAGTLDLRFPSLPQSDYEQLLSRAKFVRKLRYLEGLFHCNFAVPDKILPEDVSKVDFTFRGVTEGKVPVWRNEIAFQQAKLELGIDLNGPPFTRPGRFALTTVEPVTIFGQQIEIGPVTVLLENAQLVNVEALQYIYSHPGQPVDLEFRVLDQRIAYRFDSFAQQPRDQLQEWLEAFKAELRREEPEELVALLDQSLQGPIRYSFLDAFNEFVAEHSELLRRLAE